MPALKLVVSDAEGREYDTFEVRVDPILPGERPSAVTFWAIDTDGMGCLLPDALTDALYDAACWASDRVEGEGPEDVERGTPGRM